ncbi:hypothetical protein H632_c20p2 [Helicosporidium sp. ATCC 50920]|nr:hypothetical protein H632_c20p2 [Helicosporidium sp. ATCC 50920]|eukprot:KDD77097.1 hypothetical protein H632_c20p2 [Helicosporidium sp. ATCC 50920]
MPVEYPGCNSRLKEAKAQSISELAAAAVQGLLPYLQSQPYVLFGHSLGAWVAFEVAQLLEANQDPDIRRPSALFVSGVRSPALVGVAYDPDGTEMHKLDPDQFWRAYERRYGHNPELEHPTLKKYLYPSLKADFLLSETYKPYSLNPFLYPLVILGGVEDARYTEQQLKAWTLLGPEEATTVHWFPGSHGFVRTAEPMLIDIMKQHLDCIAMCLAL